MPCVCRDLSFTHAAAPSIGGKGAMRAESTLLSIRPTPWRQTSKQQQRERPGRKPQKKHHPKHTRSKPVKKHTHGKHMFFQKHMNFNKHICFFEKNHMFFIGRLLVHVFSPRWFDVRTAVVQRCQLAPAFMCRRRGQHLFLGRSCVGELAGLHYAAPPRGRPGPHRARPPRIEDDPARIEGDPPALRATQPASRTAQPAPRAIQPAPSTIPGRSVP